MAIIFELYQTEPPTNQKKDYIATLGAADSKRGMAALLGRIRYNEELGKYVCEKIAPETKAYGELNNVNVDFKKTVNEEPVIIGSFKKESDAVACLWEARQFLLSKWV